MLRMYFSEGKGGDRVPCLLIIVARQTSQTRNNHIVAGRHNQQYSSLADGIY